MATSQLSKKFRLIVTLLIILKRTPKTRTPPEDWTVLCTVVSAGVCWLVSHASQLASTALARAKASLLLTAVTPPSDNLVKSLFLETRRSPPPACRLPSPPVTPPSPPSRPRLDRGPLHPPLRPNSSGTWTSPPCLCLGLRALLTTPSLQSSNPGHHGTIRIGLD